MSSNFTGVDVGLGTEDYTGMQWSCYLCGKPASGISIIVFSVEHVIEGSIQIAGISVHERTRIKGNVEFVPYCQEHDTGSNAFWTLKAPLTDTLKKEIESKFPVMKDAEREIKL